MLGLLPPLKLVTQKQLFDSSLLEIRFLYSMCKLRCCLGFSLLNDCRYSFRVSLFADLIDHVFNLHFCFFSWFFGDENVNLSTSGKLSSSKLHAVTVKD